MDKKLLYQKKKEVLNLFVRNLLEGSTGSNVEKIILFGSMVWGHLGRESDIDLIILSKNPNKVEKSAFDLSYDIMLNKGELVEPLVYSQNEYVNPKSAIVMKALLDGQEIYAK